MVSFGLLLLTPLSAQVVGIDSTFTTGFPLGPFLNPAPNGRTSIHFYPASRLKVSGVCANSQLLDFAIAASGVNANGPSGVFQCSSALVQIGHLTVSPPIPGNWNTNLDQPVTVFAPAQGLFSLPWVANQWVSLPGVQSAGFVWDGVRDIGIRISIAANPSGTLWLRTSGHSWISTETATPSSQVPITGSAHSAMQVRLTFAPSTTCATVNTVGNGCLDSNTGYYKIFLSPGTFDLGSAPGQERRLIHTRSAGGYSVSSGVGGWFQPGGAPLTTNGSGLPLGQDSITRPLVLPFAFPIGGGSTSVVHASVNGLLLLGPNSATSDDLQADGNTLVNGLPKMAPLWAPLRPDVNGGAAGVYFDVAPDNQTAFVTWRECALDGASAPLPQQSLITFQIALRSNGDFEYRYRVAQMPPTATGTILVGWSPGPQPNSTHRLPLPIDISQPSVQFTLGTANVLPLTLAGSPPALGTTMLFTTTNVPVFAPFGLLILASDTVPGVDLGATGAPSCWIHLSGFLGSAVLPINNGSATFPLTVPGSASLLGSSFGGQSVAFSPHTAMGLQTSNGLLCTIGN
ncbi:MAG: hypothetical protein MUC36_01220 [Planctomycetes bacterium]|nr:hypothetical protein [Planctomycetota bacterium]